MKKIHLILALIFLFSGFLFADITEYYEFVAGTTTYAEITGTAITSIQSDDALSEAINIGFTFPYCDDSYTNVKVSSNSWIGLGTSASGSNLSNSLSGNTTYPYIAPLWDDTSMSSGTVQYQTTGTAPNRIFTVQYQNVKWNYSATNQFNYQVLFYENGKIEFIYGPSSGTPNSPSASIGINVNPGGATNFYSVTPGPPASVSSTAENSSISTCPASGTKYTFNIFQALPNDLAALTISGNTTPTVGTPATYTVTVRNRGSNPQSAYSVKLMSGTTELATVAGPAIAPGISIPVELSWTPTTAGPISIYGKVVLTGDGNTNNDQTPPMDVTVMPEGTIVVTIGDGSQNAQMPLDFYWKNSLYETIYQADEFTAGGVLMALTFYNNFVTNLPNGATKIWLGITDQTDLANNWIPSTQLTQVFDGTVEYPSGQNEILIPLQTPFPFAGGNLVMMVNRPLDTVYYSSSDYFQCQTVGATRSRLSYDDVTEFDPANPDENDVTVSGQFPKTTFSFVATGNEPQFAISPQSGAFGQKIINTTSNITFNVMNVGGGTTPLGINSITISGSPFFTLQNLPTLPASLTTGQSTTFVVRYQPAAVGDHTATVTVTDDLTRTQHEIPITGSCMDPQIYTSPYVQNFDSVTTPNLPLDWNKIATTPATVTTSTTTPHSAPNCVYIYNSSTTSGPFLLSPPIAPTLPINTMRTKFWARGGTNYTLSVGIIADPEDPDTYTEIQNLTLTSSWAEYTVGFQTYAGGGHFVAYKHGNSSTYQSIYIDDVTIEVIPQNDLSAVSVTGNTTPSVGAASPYTVNLFNWGTITQNNYTVKLYDSNDIELASVAGPVIEPGLTAQAILNWTPTAEGAASIYGKVILTGDQNNLNDESPELDVSVQPQGTIAVTIGDGSQTSYQAPVNMFYRCSLYENIYFPEDIPAGGMLNTIVFYNNFSTNLLDMPTIVWLGITDQTDLSGGWIHSTDLTQVFNGTVDYPNGPNTITIPLDQPFPYAGGNLVMMVKRPMDTTYYSTSDVFYCQTVGTDHARLIYSDTIDFDPTSITGGTLTGLFPKTTLFFTATGNTPQFVVSPDSYDYGLRLINTTTDKTFNIMNIGGGTTPLGINSITISGSPYFTLQNLPTLPASLTTGQAISFIARYNPTEDGDHTATITITDDLARTHTISLGRQARDSRTRTEHTVALSANCMDPMIYESPYAQDFDSVTTPNLPLDWAKIEVSPGYVNSSTSQTHSTPNSIYMYNSTATTGPYLIAPPITDTIPINTMRIKFWARGGTNYALSVGMIVDPADAGTYTEIENLTLTSDWAEYTVGYQTYNGNGQYMAIKHGNAGTYQGIYIDDVMIEVIPDNDLAAVSLTGNSTPSVGMATNYTVNLFNWGTLPQDDYLVKLYKEGDVEVSSVNGPTINPGMAEQAIVSWSPTEQGQTYIYAKVILTGDQNELNDQTPNFNVWVQPAGVMYVTIGDGSQTARMPMDFYWKNSLNETIYLQSELNFLGMITGITLYNNFSESPANGATKIWMGTTTVEDLSGGWIPATELTQVFDGVVDYPTGENIINITFPNPFLYLEGNLVIMFNRPMDTVYYSSSDYFYCQTIGTNRALNLYSDTTTYDPNSPPTGTTPTGQFAKTTLFVIPGGVGHLTGTVYGAGNVPLENAEVQIVNGAQTTTNASGHYEIHNIIAGDYQVSCSRYGYIAQTVNVAIPEDSTVVQNFTLDQMPTVTVTGTVVGSDAPTIGIEGAIIHVTGYEEYNATTNASGVFSIPGVYANQDYEYTVSAAGYQNTTGAMTVGATNMDMGTMMLEEIAYTPRNVVATEAIDFQSVTVAWQAPDPNAVDITESFENDEFPPTDWSQIITNNGPANTVGVYPTWCRFGEVMSGTTTVTPPDGTWQCGFWWDYNHQDEWLITPQFNCPQGATLSFGSYYYRGSTNGDHYYVEATNDNGNNWTVLWDASTLTGGWSNYEDPIVIDLGAFTGQQIKVAWHADDPNTTNDGMWYNWFIDDVTIASAVGTLHFPASTMTVKSAKLRQSQPRTVVTDLPMSRAIDKISLTGTRSTGAAQHNSHHRNSRTLLGYMVYRLVQGQEMNETTWTELTPAMITDLTLVDDEWATLTPGTYKWAVKGIYTSDVYSLAVFSNPLVKQTPTMGVLAGFVRNPQNNPIIGATVTAGPYNCTSAANGSYTMQVAAGTYTVTCSAPNYNTVTATNIVITEGMTTIHNFILSPTGNEDEVQVTATALVGNYPNPFNPETAINYDVKDACPVRIDIYNAKGQLIRTLVNELKATGHYKAVWDGRDNHGNAVASGVYAYRMQAGDYKSTRRMMLMK